VKISNLFAVLYFLAQKKREYKRTPPVPQSPEIPEEKKEELL
jgi:hypothetical protein